MLFLLGGGCGPAPPPLPALPELNKPLPGPPPEPSPGEVDQEELTLLSMDGEPLQSVDLATDFRAVFRFHLVKPPEGGLQRVRIRIIAYVNHIPTTAWTSIGPPIPEENGFYRYEAELHSPDSTRRQYYITVDLGEKQVIFEEELNLGT